MADLLEATVDLTNQTLAVLTYRTALRIHEIVRTMQGSDWAVEALDITVSSLKGDLRIGDATPLMMAPVATPGSDVALAAHIGNFRLSANAHGKYEAADDLIEIFVEAVTDPDSIADIVRTDDSEKLSQLIFKDALVLRELKSSSENASTSEMVNLLGDLWNSAESGRADSIAIRPSYIAVLVDGDTVDESSFRSTITPKLCELTNLSQNEIAGQYQIQVLRGSKEEVDRIISKQAVGIVVAMELSISLRIPDIGTLFSDGKLKSSEHFLIDSDAGLRYGLVVLYEDSMT